MNDDRFDLWSRKLADAGSRRQALRLMARSALGLGLAGKALPAKADDLPDDLPGILHPLLGNEAVVVDTNFTPDTNPELKNPERGIYYWSSTPASFGCGDSDDTYHTIVAEWLYLGKDQESGTDYCNQELTWNGHNKTGTTKRLNDYANVLVRRREDGKKVVFRPRYDNKDDDTDLSNGCRKFQAEDLGLQLRHIEQVAKMLGEFKDVIAFIEAGYLGRWGEWNTYKFPGTAPLLDSRIDRIKVVNHILLKYQEAGLRQQVGLRRPVFAQEALDQNSNARVSIYNDCFLSSDNSRPSEEWDDTGTYLDFPGSLANVGGDDPDQVRYWRDWAQRETANMSFGGETCAAGGDERWRYCENMIGTSSEPRLMHMSYLHPREARLEWCKASPPCYDEIRSKLGYRFAVKHVEYTPQVAPGERMLVRILVENTGWARLHKPRQAKIVLRDGGPPHVVEDQYASGGAVASWGPGESTTIEVDAPAPPRAGTYSVRLWIPDPDLLKLIELLDQPDAYPVAQIKYAVKLATKRKNRNLFDDTTGENDLGVTITVQ